jgi:hypothetical protein
MIAGTTPANSAGSAMPIACTTRAANRSVGRENRCPSQAHSAEDDRAARPTSTQAPLQSGAVRAGGRLLGFQCPGQG